VYRLSGVMRTDPSLAGRTYAFRIDRGAWDADWLEAWGLSPGLFPPVAASGEPVGAVSAGGIAGLPPGTPVAIAGHDHVSAAFAAGALAPGRVFDSMGTAEALLGALDGQSLGPQEFASGLMYGCHTAHGRLYWMGGLSASGGSVEWLRGVLGDPPLSYAALQELLERDLPQAAPTGILYFPYLNGSGSPHSDLRVRGAFLGLDATHGRADLLQAVLEGAAYELEFIRRTAERTGGRAIETIVAAGGGTRNRRWMQIKADVSGCRIEVFPTPEASLVGAALLAGAGCGVFSSQAQAAGAFAGGEVEVYTPDPARRSRYLHLYEQGYLQFQEPLRQAARRGWAEKTDEAGLFSPDSPNT
jgi:sugar (pentulose or hexulose) kinase